ELARLIDEGVIEAPQLLVRIAISAQAHFVRRKELPEEIAGGVGGAGAGARIDLVERALVQRGDVEDPEAFAERAPSQIVRGAERLFAAVLEVCAQRVAV